jgi:SulP family sulfate permease
MKHASFPLATALRQSLHGYNLKVFKQDFFAALVVSMMALPLSMALAIAVGLPPQYGLYTAIVAGIITPLVGGSMTQVSGPTAAFVVILAPIVAELGVRGIVWAGILAGILLIVMGTLRFGRLINYIPYPVTTGFTAGIALVLMVLSLNDFLGLNAGALTGSFVHKLSMLFSSLPHLNPYESSIGIVSLTLLFISARFIKFVPAAIIAMLVAVGMTLLYQGMGLEISTIGNRFEGGLPGVAPTLHWPSFTPGEIFSIPNFNEWKTLLAPGFTIAMLAALESLLSATVADSLAGTKHNPNAELNGIGIGNIFSSLAMGIPATGAIARTATNIQNGGRTPISSSLHAVFILIYVLLLAPAINYLPMAALSALLIHAGYRMSHARQFVRTILIAPRSDTVVLLVCFTLTVFVDMVMGVSVGIICAAFLLMRRVADLTQVELETSEEPLANKTPLPPGALVYRISGPLFFGTIEKAFDRYEFTHDYITDFILDISSVPFIDMTGLVALQSMFKSIANEKRTIHVICRTPAVLEKIQQKIKGEQVREYVQFHESFDRCILMH